jgi:hypothetical protein
MEIDSAERQQLVHELGRRIAHEEPVSVLYDEVAAGSPLGDYYGKLLLEALKEVRPGLARQIEAEIAATEDVALFWDISGRKVPEDKAMRNFAVGAFIHRGYLDGSKARENAEVFAAEIVGVLAENTSWEPSNCR